MYAYTFIIYIILFYWQVSTCVSSFQHEEFLLLCLVGLLSINYLNLNQLKWHYFIFIIEGYFCFTWNIALTVPFDSFIMFKICYLIVFWPKLFLISCSPWFVLHIKCHFENNLVTVKILYTFCSALLNCLH